jgi:beta-carotene 3-hydroxylase
MQIIINILWVIAAFWFMEFMAWFIHKYVMHTFAWTIHRDHHQPTENFFQRNDMFAIIFAIPSWLNMQLGVMAGFDFRFYIGLGILFYGIAYTVVHEVIIHNRWGNRDKIKNRYLQGLARAHFAHHKHKEKEDGECFGMLIVPFKYFKKN